MSPVDFGIFDHLERRADSLGELYDGRLRLLKMADEAGFYGYHLAEHHATPLGMAPSPGVFLVGGHTTHQAHSFGAAGVFAAAVSSAATDQ